MSDPIAWSCGGGKQSVAIAVLIGEGALPVPDYAGIVDTSREVQSTWDYLRDVLNPYLLRKRGFEVQRVPHTFARVDMYDKDGLPLVPAYTAEGRLAAFCSGEWKRDAFERWLRSLGVEQATMWIGYSLDEKHRATGKAHRSWLQPAYPLIERRLNLGACIRIIEAAGLPVPHKSRCFGCPHQDAEEWAEVAANPEEWAAAVRLDEEIRQRDPQGKGLYLHSSRVPLAMADLAVDDAVPLFRGCQDAGCFT
jgi:hypothetical protein